MGMAPPTSNDTTDYSFTNYGVLIAGWNEPPAPSEEKHWLNLMQARDFTQLVSRRHSQKLNRRSLEHRKYRQLQRVRKAEFARSRAIRRCNEVMFKRG